MAPSFFCQSSVPSGAKAWRTPVSEPTKIAPVGAQPTRACSCGFTTVVWSMIVRFQRKPRTGRPMSWSCACSHGARTSLNAPQPAAPAAPAAIITRKQAIARTGLLGRGRRGGAAVEEREAALDELGETGAGVLLENLLVEIHGGGLLALERLDAGLMVERGGVAGVFFIGCDLGVSLERLVEAGVARRRVGLGQRLRLERVADALARDALELGARAGREEDAVGGDRLVVLAEVIERRRLDELGPLRHLAAAEALVERLPSGELGLAAILEGLEPRRLRLAARGERLDVDPALLHARGRRAEDLAELGGRLPFLLRLDAAPDAGDDDHDHQGHGADPDRPRVGTRHPHHALHHDLEVVRAPLVVRLGRLRVLLFAFEFRHGG